MQVNPKKGSIKFGKGSNNSPHFVEPFEFLKIIGSMDYCIDLPLAFHRMHDVFHVLVLWCYVLYASHILDWNNLKVPYKVALKVELVCFLDWHTWQLQSYPMKVYCDLYIRPTLYTLESTNLMFLEFPFFNSKFEMEFPKGG